MVSKTSYFSTQEMSNIIDWLLSQRLTNYGYNYKDFKRLSNYASKFRKLIKWFYRDIITNREVLQGDFMSGRLRLVDGKVDYIIGQSFNEEYINLMAEILERVGVYKRRKWLY